MLVKGITNSEIEGVLAQLKPRQCVTCLRQWRSLKAPQSKFCNRFCEETYPATMKARSRIKEEESKREHYWQIQNAEMRNRRKLRGDGYNPRDDKRRKRKSSVLVGDRSEQDKDAPLHYFERRDLEA